MMKIVVVGAGGHARSVCEVIIAQGRYEIIGLVDPGAQEGFFDIPLLGNDSLLGSLYREGRAEGVFVALGSNSVRKKLMRVAAGIGYTCITAISPHAVVSRFCSIGVGSVVMPGAVINAGTTIGEGCILNTNSSVDHDCTIGDYCHIAPGATLCGCVTVGEGTFVGAGARIIDRIQLGSHIMLGAGAVAIRNLPPSCTAVGVPARIIKQGE